MAAALALFVAGAASPAWAGSGSNPVLPRPTTVTDARVEALARVGNRVYLGGRFAYAGPHTGSGVGLDQLGHRDPRFPTLHGAVNAVVADGAGGFFVGGWFPAEPPHVIPEDRRHLVHVLADGRIDRRFGEPLDAPVTALALGNGRLYVATAARWRRGDVTHEVLSFDLARGTIDPTFSVSLNAPLRMTPTGIPSPTLSRDRCPELDYWRTRRESGVVALVASPRHLYVGGDFERVNGVARADLVAVDPATGAVDEGFAPRVGQSAEPYPRLDSDTDVRALALAGSRLLVGGRFRTVGGVARRGLVALDPDSGALDARFAPRPHPDVEAIVPGNGVLYVAQPTYGLPAEPELVALDPGTGARIPGFEAPPDIFPHRVAAAGERLFVTHNFDTGRGAIVALDARTGRRERRVLVRTNRPVEALAASGDRLFAGGRFDSAGGAYRTSVAALDARTGRLDRRFVVSGARFVKGFATAGGRLFATGSFTTPAQKGRRATREGVVALDPVTGRRLRGFDAPSIYAGSAIAARGRTLYVADLSTREILALDAHTGARRAAFRSPVGDPHLPIADTPDAPVPLVMEVARGRVYVGVAAGRRGARQRGVLALDPRTGRMVSGFRAPRLDPEHATSATRALAYGSGRLYASGEFAARGAASATLALDPVTGRPDPRFRSLPFSTSALALVDSTLVAASPGGAGRLITVAARTGRGGIAASRYVGRVCALLATPTRLYAAGDLWSWEGRPWSNLAALPLYPAPPM